MEEILKETPFQEEIENLLVERGWVSGKSSNYDSVNALYTEDLITFFSTAYPEEWKKYQSFFPKNTEDHFVKFVVSQFDKRRERGNLDVIRKELKDRGVRIKLSANLPVNLMNTIAIDRYNKNIFRVVREVVYSPHGSKNRIDLVLFLNGIPIATIETKSEFKQDLANAIKQYKYDRPVRDKETKKKEPLLTFKRGALVHFAVGENEIYMTTKLDGTKTFFLPFNKGKGGLEAGNPQPEDGSYPISYFWDQILKKENLIKIIHNYVHLERKKVEDEDGRISFKETMIFPRFHQWEVVTKLIDASLSEGVGNNYLIQHSAGSGKSNSIAWLAHQASNLFKDDEKVFNTVIVVTDRKVLDSQLQDTIFQFEHQSGVVSRIGHEDDGGRGSKSKQLAENLIKGTNIVIVTIQTFPFVIEAIKAESSLKDRNFAIIADEAHSSQTGKAAAKLKAALNVSQDSEEEMSAEDILNEYLGARKKADNISYFAFTATPKAKTLEIFGRPEDTTMPTSKENLPRPFHLYSMRQAIQEGFIRDVLINYTNYKVLYELEYNSENDQKVDSKIAKKKIAQFARFHEYNISQKVKVMVEHFRKNVANRLNRQAKAMIITSSRKEAASYKLKFDEYVKENSYDDLKAIVAFSGEIKERGLDTAYTEANMNDLKGKSIPEAFDGDDYQLLLVANKYQTGFDQPKLCAMYVDKKLGGVDCVQTLSRLNRNYPGKTDEDVFILDFCNDTKDIEDAFKPYYGETKIDQPTDPNLVYDIQSKIYEENFIFSNEVDLFCNHITEGVKSRSLLNKYIIPARDRFNKPYQEITKKIKRLNHELSQATGEIQRENVQTEVSELKKKKDHYDVIKKDCSTFIRLYDFVSQVIEYNDIDLEKFYLYLTALTPMLARGIESEDDFEITGLKLNKYRIDEVRQKRIDLEGDSKGVDGVTSAGSGRGRDKKDAMLSEILKIINELHGADQLTVEDRVKYFNDQQERFEKDPSIIKQIKSNSLDQMKAIFKNKFVDSILDNMNVNEVHKLMGEDLIGREKEIDELSYMMLKRLYAKYKKK